MTAPDPTAELQAAREYATGNLFTSPGLLQCDCDGDLEWDRGPESATHGNWYCSTCKKNFAAHPAIVRAFLAGTHLAGPRGAVAEPTVMVSATGPVDQEALADVVKAGLKAFGRLAAESVPTPPAPEPKLTAEGLAALRAIPVDVALVQEFREGGAAAEQAERLLQAGQKLAAEVVAYMVLESGEGIDGRTSRALDEWSKAESAFLTSKPEPTPPATGDAERLIALAEAATAPPWITTERMRDPGCIVIHTPDGESILSAWNLMRPDGSEPSTSMQANADFVCAARTLAPAVARQSLADREALVENREMVKTLLLLAKEQKAEIERLREALEFMRTERGGLR